MSLVRKRKSSSVKVGGASKAARTETVESAASHDAPESLPEERRREEEEGPSTSPWFKAAKVKCHGQGAGPDSDTEGCVASTEAGSVLCSSPARPRPQTEEDTTDTDLLVIITEDKQCGWKGRKKGGGGGKRKRRPAEDESGDSESEKAGPEMEIDRQLDQQLENKSRQHNLTTTNVRNIIHEVITNEHVVAMMKAAINETEVVPVFEPKMTRSKLKEVVEKGVVIPAWNISPIKKASEAPQFVDIPLEEEDSSDEEYHPGEEEEDETDTFQESDMESTASSPRGSRAGVFRFHPENDDDSCSPMQVFRHRARRHMGPPLPPLAPPTRPPPDSSSFLEKLHAVEEELAIGPAPACMEPFQPPSQPPPQPLGLSEESVMAWRTRSKRPLRDVPMGRLEAELQAPDITPDMYECGSAPEDREWTHWLRGLMCSDAENDEEGDDDDDPEYNFLADRDEPDLEDYRNDRAVRITKKEVNQLMEELFETFQEELCSQEQDEEGHEEEEESQEEAPASDTPTFNTPAPPPPWTEPVCEEEEEEEEYETVREELAAMRKRRGLCRPTPQPFTPRLDPPQRRQLQQQIQQHVQLLTQVTMLTSPVAVLHSEAHTTTQFLAELQAFAQSGELSRGLQPGFRSVFRASNLQGALALLEELRLQPLPYHSPAAVQPSSQGRVRRYPLMSAPLAWLFATRPVFLYPQLLPLVSLDPALFASPGFTLFTPAESCLLVLGLRNLQKTPEPIESLCRYLLRAKTPEQVKRHIRDKTKASHPDNLIKAYHRQKEVWPMPLACGRVEPGDLRPPVEREENIMPGWLRRSLSVIYPAVRELNASSQSPGRPRRRKRHPACDKQYHYPPGTRYPPTLPDRLTLKPYGFRLLPPRPPSSRPAQNVTQGVLHGPAPPAAPLAKDLVTQKVGTFAGLRRLPRLLPYRSRGSPREAPPPTAPLEEDWVTVTVLKEEWEEEECREKEREEEEEEEEECGGDSRMFLLALSETSASPASSDDPGDPTEEEGSQSGQEVTLTPGPSAAGGRGREEQEVMSPASHESTLSVPELQETMEKLSWLASESRSEFTEGSPPALEPLAPPPSTPPLPGEDDQLLEGDAHREKKETSFARDYLTRVGECLQQAPERLRDFLVAVSEFEQAGAQRTAVELFTRLRPVLQAWPHLLRDFAAFLHPEQASECGLLAEQQAFERSRRFLRQLEMSFGEDSSHYHDIVSILQGGPAHCPAGIKQMKAQIAHLLRDHAHLQGEFWVFFNELHSQSSSQGPVEAEEDNAENSTPHNASQRGQRSRGSRPRKDKRRAESLEQTEGGSTASDRPVCAKNISLTPTGEKVVLWTREADRTILTACQQSGANQRTFKAVSARLGNKTANEVSERFQDLMRLFRSAAQSARSGQEGEVKEAEQPIKEPDPD